MIPIDRTLVVKPESLTAPNGAGYNEHLRAVDYYKTPQTKAYKFNNYKGPDVITALNTLFSDKCAYCEGKIAKTGPIDVEHFRPKGKIKCDPNHPGYWWLATEWTNLLACCIDCNRSRTQVLLDSPDGLQVSQSEQLSGKHDRFPVNGKRSTCATDNHDLEDPLLIDPTRIDPGDHIKWKVIADYPLAINLSPHGQTSIKVYGLNRLKLVEARRELQLKLESEFQCLKALISNIAQEPTDEGLVRWMPILQIYIDNFFKHAETQNEYSAFARYLVETRFEEVRALVEGMAG